MSCYDMNMTRTINVCVYRIAEKNCGRILCDVALKQAFRGIYFTICVCALILPILQIVSNRETCEILT